MLLHYHSPKKHRTSWLWTETSETASQKNLSFFRTFQLQLLFHDSWVTAVKPNFFSWPMCNRIAHFLINPTALSTTFSPNTSSLRVCPWGIHTTSLCQVFSESQEKHHSQPGSLLCLQVSALVYFSKRPSLTMQLRVACPCFSLAWGFHFLQSAYQRLPELT